LLHELVPKATTIAMLTTRAEGPSVREREARDAAATLGLQLRIFNINAERELDAAYATLLREPPDAMLLMTGPLLISHAQHITEFAALLGIPAIYDRRDYTAVGGLMSYGDSVAEKPQMVSRRQSRRSGADDQYALARFSCRRLEAPAALERLVTEKPLDRIDADRRVELTPVARCLARVIADAAHDRRQRIVTCEHAPGRLVVAGFRMVEPALDVFAGGTGVIARRKPIDVQGPAGSPGASLVGER
jgi:hypothetical protein